MTIEEAERIYNERIDELRNKEKEGVPAEIIFAATENAHKELEKNILIALS